MHGKAVKFRHCPATVNGKVFRERAATVDTICGKAVTLWSQPQVRRPVSPIEPRSEGERLYASRFTITTRGP
jgi:hypothetical protein